MSVCKEPNLRQTRTAGDLLRHHETAVRGPVTLYLAPYGSVGDCLAIMHDDDNPAPNPIVRIWGIDGNAYIVESENDYARWLESFESDAERLSLDRPSDFIAAVERADDTAYVIHSGGSYRPFNTDNL